MEQSIFLCPFTKRAHKGMLYSFLIRMQQNQCIILKPSHLRSLAQDLLLSPLTLRRQLLSFTQTKHFSIRRVEQGIEIRRFDTVPTYCGVSISSDFIYENDLSSSELILFAAILMLQRGGKDALTRKQLACRTGFSMRQVAYSLKSLYSKKLLTQDTQHEDYVRHTKEGRIEDIRERRIWVVSSHILNLPCFKIAPLKESNRYPVINNRSFSTHSVENSLKKSDLEEVWKKYKKKFKAHDFESLKGTKKTLLKHKNSLPRQEKIFQILQKFLETPFLKIAHQFGWQEAIVECYGRKKCFVGDSSRHINKYGSHKPGLVWIIQHATEILTGKYTPKEMSWAQRIWKKGGEKLQKKPDSPASKATLKTLPPLWKMEEEIRNTPSYSLSEREARISVLKRVGGVLYNTWIKTCQVLELKKGIINLKAPNSFTADMILKKLILPFNLKLKIV